MYRLKWLLVFGIICFTSDSMLHAQDQPGDLVEDGIGNIFILVDLDADGDVDIARPPRPGDIFNGPGGLWELVDIDGDGEIDGTIPQEEEEGPPNNILRIKLLSAGWMGGDPPVAPPTPGYENAGPMVDLDDLMPEEEEETTPSGPGGTEPATGNAWPWWQYYPLPLW